MGDNNKQLDNTKGLQNLKDIIQAFHKELDSVYEKAASGDVDIHKLHEKLLEMMWSGFRIPVDQLGEKGYTIDPGRLDQIINEIAEEKGFIAVSKPAVDAKNVLAKWTLEKEILGEESKLWIVLKTGNYIGLSCSDDWDTTAFGYDTFRHVISCWADGIM